LLHGFHQDRLGIIVSKGKSGAKGMQGIYDSSVTGFGWCVLLEGIERM